MITGLDMLHRLSALSPIRNAMLAAVSALACTVPATTISAQILASGPLTVHPQNPRYFADALGRPVYLTGSHTWTNFQEEWIASYNIVFDNSAYLDMLVEHHHNFIRLWRAELPAYKYGGDVEYRYSAPHPWRRVSSTPSSGGGSIGTLVPKPPPAITPSWSDTRPGGENSPISGRHDLTSFDEAYFQRLRQRCIDAGNRGIYVGIMLFEGHGLQFTTEGWASHPFNAANNINGINGDLNGDGRGTETHTLANPAVTSLQETYVRKVIDTVNDLDNVIFEIANESHVGSVQWQMHFVNYIQQYESTKPKQHPVWFSSPFPYAGEAMWTSNAQAVSPLAFSAQGSFSDNPPAADGSKVVICDSDHIFGCGSDVRWVWKCFSRGLNPIYMDSYYPDTPFCLPPDIDMRRNMGFTRDYAQRMDLAACLPRNELASTGYCLANVGNTYLVYLPTGGQVTVDLSGASGTYTVEWFNPQTGSASTHGVVTGGGPRTIAAPFSGHAALFLFSGSSGQAIASPGSR